MVLGITNRTENWKTASFFTPLFGEGSTRLARRLGEPEVRLELYWTGMRDYLNENGGKTENDDEDFAERFRHLFPGLRKAIEESGRRFQLNHNSYDVSTKDRVANLGNNLYYTEIDIVLETPKHLFIGEAKHQSDFGADRSYVLVHQLIRQYAMATILVDRIAESDKDKKREIVPFIVGDKNRRQSIRDHAQVEFMIQQGWLKKENILSWDDVRELWP